MGILVLQRSRYERQQQAAGSAAYARQEERLAIGVAVQKRLPALGFDNLVADWAFLQFVQYYGDTEARQQTGYSLVDDYFEIASGSDPRFWRANLTFSVATSLLGSRPDRSVELLDRTIPFQIPNTYGDYYSRTYGAVDRMLFLGDNEGARRAYEEAALIADAIPAEILARRARETASFLATNPGSRRARVGAWFQLLAGAADEETRDIILAEIEKLGGRVQRNADGSVSVIPPED